MFGWEFPPHSRGGLGTACYGLTKGLSNHGVDITFVLPRGYSKHPHVDLITTEDLYIGNKKIKMKYIDSLLLPYINENDYEMSLKGLFGKGGKSGIIYGKNLFEEVNRFADKAKIIAMFESFDIIHCHDWMTFKAGIKAKEVSGKRLVVHVHATDFDRTGGHPNQTVYDIEKEGMQKADKIIAVSNLTKNMIVKYYGIDPNKITVVHNAVEHSTIEFKESKIKSGDKVVLFLGRLTIQKGPDYFIEAAHRVLQIMSNVKFIIAGSGDMYRRMVDRAAELGMGKNVLFTGHLTGPDIDKAYQMADLYVMPSISEPFGITPLEALKNNTPVLISKQSGVAEVLNNVLKVDFWDIDDMTNKIVSVLNYPKLHESLAQNGHSEMKRMSWDDAAAKCIQVYTSV